MSAGPKNLAESIRHRLRNRCRERGEDAQFAMSRYAHERFLYRLGESPLRGRFILKGAMLFPLWGGAEYRPTRDLDLMGYGENTQEAILAALGQVCAVEGGEDGLLFDATSLSAEPIRDDAEYHGLRVRFQASLGTSRIPMQIDVGFGNAIEPAPVEVEYPTLLGHPPPRIRAYPQEAVIAEKLHAMVVLGVRNSRFKDFYDLYVLARQFKFDGRSLAQAIAATFERRSTPIDPALPVALTPAFYGDAARAAQWRAYCTRNSLPGAPLDFGRVGETLVAFLAAPWNALAAGRKFSGQWSPAGPWAQAAAGGEG